MLIGWKRTFGVNLVGTFLCLFLLAVRISGLGGSGEHEVMGLLGNVGALIVGFAAIGLVDSRRRLWVLFAVGTASAVLIGVDDGSAPATMQGSLTRNI